MVKGTLQSSPAGEDPAILPRKISFHGRIKKGCSFRGKGGVVLQVQNSAHAWQELPCGYTHHRRFWHVFEWAEWYSWGEFCSYETRVFWWDSAFSRVSADVFCFFFFFFLLQKFYIVFYTSYASICKDLQKTIVLSSGPFRQVFTFTIQCICNLWWSESSRSEAIP